MSGSRELAEHLADALAPVGKIELRRFFGGWGLHAHNTLFAMVMDTLYFRVDDTLRAELAARGGAPFTYGAKGKRVVVERFYSAPSDTIDNAEALCAFATLALGRASP